MPAATGLQASGHREEPGRARTRKNECIGSAQARIGEGTGDLGIRSFGAATAASEIVRESIIRSRMKKLSDSKRRSEVIFPPADRPSKSQDSYTGCVIPTQVIAHQIFLGEKP